MKIAWIYPDIEKDGISIYSRRYVESLKEFVDVEIVDFEFCFNGSLSKKIDSGNFDAVHIQYEPSFFMRKNRDYYPRIASTIKVPLVVSLHEVYDRFPGVFPRESITGPLAGLKKSLYDMRHPANTFYSRSCRKSFCATKVLVHYGFQRRILEQQGVKPERIAELPLPVTVLKRNAPGREEIEGTGNWVLRLGSTGFINPNYNYDLLLKSLEKLEIPWHFTWIGGLRRQEDKQILDDLQKQIARRGWNDKFEITGWVGEDEQAQRLFLIDIYAALFLNRSSSASLMSALGAGLPIIAAKLPLTEEIASDKKAILAVDSEPGIIAAAIKTLATDKAERNKLAAQAADYAERNSYRQAAKKIAGLYDVILRAKKGD
jgi:glycosyltransferase involved in cell wall biosynthesis